MMSNGKFELQAVIVLYSCSDGTLRPVKFGKSHAKQVHGYITHIQGGKVDFRDEPALLVQDTPATRAAMEELQKPAPTGMSTLLAWARKFLSIPKPQKVFAAPPGEDHAITSATSTKVEVKAAS